jgi:hypothetical protein
MTVRVARLFTVVKLDEAIEPVTLSVPPLMMVAPLYRRGEREVQPEPGHCSKNALFTDGGKLDTRLSAVGCNIEIMPEEGK